MLSISKQQLSEFPEVRYPGKVIIVDSAAKCKSALGYLNRVEQVGFDTETRPSFKKFQHYDVSLAQISCGDECFLFRLKMMGGTDEFFKFLENEDVHKIGLSLRDDFNQLHKLAPFNPGGFVELQSFVKKFEIADNSLQRIFGIIFNKRISKHQRLTNWEAPVLTPSQLSYAAIDAWACQQIYNYLVAGKFNPADSPYVLEEVCEDQTHV